MTRLETVLQYARQGWSVIPVEAKGKKPLIDSWKPNQDERASEEQIIAWWTRWPDANIGIVTGSISGIIVLDVDGEEGQKTIKTSGLHLPPTVTAKTGGGGYHYLYKHPGFACKNSAGSIGQNIDFRGDGGYIVAPGSLHKSGNVYEWVLSPEDAELADAPEWLLQAIKGQGKPQGVQCPDWGDTVPQGQRNDTLTKLAGSLLAKMGADDALPMLLAWNQTKCAPPLPEAEVQRTVESVWNLENQNQACSEPENLDVELLPVSILPPAIIPEPFSPWLEDVAYRMQCPLDFVAIGTMVVAGSVIGAGCGIRPKKYDDWLVIPNLWGGIIARPSMMKTPALSEIIAPLKRLEAQAKRDYELELAEAEVEQVVIKAAKDSIVGEMKRAASGKSKKNMEQLKEELADLEDPPVPARRRFVTNDPTIEKMAELLNESPRGLLYFRDELVGLLLNLEREDRQADRAFYLEAWNGYGSYTTDRIGRGTIDTENMCVSILGGIQPSKLLGYLYQAKSD